MFQMSTTFILEKKLSQLNQRGGCTTFLHVLLIIFVLFVFLMIGGLNSETQEMSGREQWGRIVV